MNSNERQNESPMRREHILYQQSKEKEDRMGKMKMLREKIEQEKTPFRPSILEKSKILALESSSVSFN